MLYIFNPEHDLAIGDFKPNYTPPASIMKMRADLSVLPIWYSEGGKVVVEDDANLRFLDNIKKLLPINSELVVVDDIAIYADEKVVPWGWNPQIRKRLISSGLKEELLPTISELNELRSYSNRVNAVEVLKELIIEDAGLCGESHYFTELVDLLLFLKHTKGNKVLKMPVSGSGRGLVWVLGDITDKQTDWCKRVMKKQGGVVAEPVIDKVLDFALEFNLSSGRAEFIGYSLFKTTSSGAYSGNYILSDMAIEKYLSAFISIEKLHKVRDSLMNKLSGRFENYNGPIGVDMMVCSVDSKFNAYRLHPCVEINMRMNMGLVSHIFRSRYVAVESEGYYLVEYFKDDGGALAFHEKMQRERPLKIIDGKIISGYLALTPVTSYTHYIAFAVVDENPFVVSY